MEKHTGRHSESHNHSLFFPPQHAQAWVTWLSLQFLSSKTQKPSQQFRYFLNPLRSLLLSLRFLIHTRQHEVSEVRILKSTLLSFWVIEKIPEGCVATDGIDPSLENRSIVFVSDNIDPIVFWGVPSLSFFFVQKVLPGPQ